MNITILLGFSLKSPFFFPPYFSKIKIKLACTLISSIYAAYCKDNRYQCCTEAKPATPEHIWYPGQTSRRGGGQDTKGAWSWGPQCLKCIHLTWTLRKGSTPLLLLYIPFLWKPIKVKTFYQSRKPFSISEHIITCIKTSVTTSSHQTWIQTRFSVKYQRLSNKQNNKKRLIPNPDPAKTQNKVLELDFFFFFFFLVNSKVS